MLLLFLVQSLSPSPAPPPAPLPDPAAAVALFSSDDYPLEAQQNGWQGTVIADVVVSPAGRISACRVVESSGHAILDNRTCEVFLTRARFVPARAEDGKPIQTVLRMPPIIWRLEEDLRATDADSPKSMRPIFSYDDYPPEALRNGWEGSAIAELRISKEGRVAACSIVKSTGHKILDDATCDLLVRRAQFRPATDEKGNPIEDTLRTPLIEWRIR